MNIFRQAQEARRIAQDQRNRDARADLARRAALPGVDPDAELRAVQARATAAAAVPVASSGTKVGRVLPPAALAAAGLAVVNPKIWQADVRPVKRRIDTPAWLARVRQAAGARERGDVLAPTLVRVAELIVWAQAKGGGFARQTFEEFANLAGCCRETARKAVRFLERYGLLDTFNVLSRAHGVVRRLANLYLIRAVAPDRDAPAGDGLADRLGRYASLFGLRPRAWGLNATPAPVGYRASRRHPSPS